MDLLRLQNKLFSESIDIHNKVHLHYLHKYKNSNKLYLNNKCGWEKINVYLRYRHEIYVNYRFLFGFFDAG